VGLGLIGKLNVISCVIFSFLLVVLLMFFSDIFLKYSSTIFGFSLIILGFVSQKPVVIFYSIFSSSYFLYLSPYFLFEVPFATRTSYQDYEVSAINMQCFAMFTMCFFIVLERGSGQFLKIKDRFVKRDNSLIFFFNVFVVLFLAVLMVNSAGTAYSADYREVTAVRYAFIDYAVVFLFLAFVFSGRGKNSIILGVAAFYLLICLLYGYRLRMIQMMLLVFFLFYEERFKPIVLALSSLLVFWGMKLVGGLRGLDKNTSWEALLGVKGDVVVSNQGGVFLNANMYIGLVNDGLISLSERLTTFLGNLLAVFYSQGALPERFNIAKLASTFFDIPGGGLISGYIYIWGGVFAAIPVGVGIGLLYSKLMNKNNLSIYFVAYMVVVVTGFPRWFAYSPIHFFKMGFYSVFMLFIFLYFNSLMMKRRL